MELRHYWAIIRRWWWIPLLTVLLTAALTLATQRPWQPRPAAYTTSLSFSVGVQIQPKLSPGHRLRLLLDGKPYGQASSSTRLSLTNIDRGEHSLAVEVLSGEQSIQQSSPVTFTVQRVNTQSPALKPKPQPKPKPKPAT